MRSYRATEIVMPFSDSTNMVAIEADAEARWGYNNMTDGQVVTALRGTLATITAWLSTRNSRQVHTIATTADMTSPWVTAAMAGAAIESSAVLDPAVPYTDIVLSGYKGPRRGEGWDLINEGNALLVAGGSPVAVGQDGTGSLLRVVTNYTQNATGADDPSTRELAWVKTMSYYRWFTITEYAKYRGYKLAEYVTDPIPGQKIMTAELVEEIQVGNYMAMMNAGLVQNLDHYKESLVVEIDGTNGKVRLQEEPVLVTQHYQTEITSYPIAGHVS